MKPALKPERLKHLLKTFQRRRIVVAGDLMLDEFIRGKVNRISPEAPVPVVEVVRESFYPGGAANVARNLRAFGCGVTLMGRIGRDLYGARLREILAADGIDLSGTVEQPDMPTIVKTRIFARQQQVVRVDRERCDPLPAEFERQAVERLHRILPEADAVIVEDYHKGFLTQSLANQIGTATQASAKLLTVDPNPGNPLLWSRPAAVKPNRAEAFAAAGHPWSEPVDPPEHDTALHRVAKALAKKWDAENLLITLGEHGMMLCRRGHDPYYSPAKTREVFDVSGAGDTVIAVFTLALSSGATPEESTELANHASGVVVGKLGTAVCSPEELTGRFLDHG